MRVWRLYRRGARGDRVKRRVQKKRATRLFMDARVYAKRLLGTHRRWMLESQHVDLGFDRLLTAYEFRWRKP